ncbi:hypothetical protein ACN265_05035 [Micromonospora sp. WMMD730]|uniref:hypothetical protein n=1 Tax=Micromonospora sp. WMMD730 TaxID=3404128 RepID=UPI003B92BC28
MEPVAGGVVLKAAISAAIKQLPKLAQGGRLPPTIRTAAYEHFTASVWSIVTGMISVRAIEPFARPRINYYHKMFQRLLESSMASQADFLGAFGSLRLVAPTRVADAAERVAVCVGDLAEVEVGDDASWAERQSALGAAMLDFTLLCRIDLGVARHPIEPKMHWYRPASWIRSVHWWWSRSRRGEWPALPEGTHAAGSPKSTTLEAKAHDQRR